MRGGYHARNRLPTEVATKTRSGAEQRARRRFARRRRRAHQTGEREEAGRHRSAAPGRSVGARRRRRNRGPWSGKARNGLPPQRTRRSYRVQRRGQRRRKLTTQRRAWTRGRRRHSQQPQTRTRGRRWCSRRPLQRRRGREAKPCTQCAAQEETHREVLWRRARDVPRRGGRPRRHTGRS